MKKILFCLSVAALILLAGCSRESASPAAAVTADEHLVQAQENRSNPENLALAIWHYEQFLKKTDGKQHNDIALAQMQLTACRALYRQQIADDSPEDAAEVQDLRLKLKNLEQRNADLQSWISRLHTENRALRDAQLGKAGRRN
jgi:hypothetical protein